MIGIGRVLLWSGGSLWIGRQTGRADEHAHHAIQIALAMRGSFAMDDDRAGWREHRGAIVMPHRRHRFDGCGSDVATIFVEPEAAQGRTLLARYGGRGVTAIEPESIEPIVAPLRERFDRNSGDDALAAEARRAVSLLAGAGPAADRVDPRIERAIAWTHERLATPISLADVAAVAHLSPSRFRHLFVAQTGVSFRASLLWARVASAMASGMNGDSWTAAAQNAGFADSAHFSRTCRRMFGIAPAMLVRG
jgi:AraC-like DNA-binding protein